MATMDDILQNVNQPVINHLINLVVSGHSRQAINELIKLEGHWITKADAINFILHIHKVYER